MKLSRLRAVAVAAVLAFVLSGCGEPLYDLTETEEGLIVNYAAHIVSKYNTYQKDGLTWVDFTPEETETEEPVPVATEEISDDTEEVPDEPDSVPSEETAGSVEAAGADAATLNELFGMQGIQIDYVNALFADSYVQDTYYAMYPDAGKQYLVVQIEMANISGEDVYVDNLSQQPTFRAVVGDLAANAELTILPEDFAGFDGLIPVGMAQETVLLFQFPTSAGDVDGMELFVTLGGEKYKIIF